MKRNVSKWIEEGNEIIKLRNNDMVLSEIDELYNMYKDAESERAGNGIFKLMGAAFSFGVSVGAKAAK